MYRILELIFYLLIAISAAKSSVEDKRFHCPNNGIPKRDKENGKLIQCLPGWASIAVCGPHYSCFFSGFNYQCCPNSSDKSGEITDEECPGNALAVLDSTGIPVHCDKSGECPSPEMFCRLDEGMNKPAICCQHFKLDDEKNPLEKRKGDMTQGEGASRKPVDILRSEQQSKSIPLDLDTTTIVPNNSVKPAGVESIYADNESNGNQSLKKVEEADHIYTNNSENEYAMPKFMGGSFQSKNVTGNLAKKFLLEQIKQGWPYSEKYYRRESNTEDIIVLRNRGMPEAIVHFPNSQ